MLKATARSLKLATNTALGVIGYELTSVSGRSFDDQSQFIPFEATIEAARRAGLSVGDYIDTIMNETPGATQLTIDEIARLGVFEKPLHTVLEIGPGSGRYLEKTLQRCKPSRYEIYETAGPWASYLAEHYDVVLRPTDGTSLAATPDKSVDLVQAHKVFSSINFLPTCCYWREMIRVMRPGAFCVFDIMTEHCLAPDVLERWALTKAGTDSYPAAMPREAALTYFTSKSCVLAGSFLSPMGVGQTEVFVFQSLRG